MFHQMLESSTPDGIAPLSFTALIVFTFCFSGVSILWGFFNLFQLYNIGPDHQEEGLIKMTNKTELIKQLCKRILSGSFHYLKFNILVCFGASLIYFFAIMGVIEQFKEFGLSMVYMLGVLFAIVCSVFITIVSATSYFRIIYTSRYSVEESFGASRFASNGITFVSMGAILIAIISLMIYYESEDKTQIQEINKRADILLSFAFGIITVGVCTKITSLTYLKGVQNGFEVSGLFNSNTKKNDRHPLVICKGIGQTVNKSLSKSLDYLIMVATVIGVVTKCAGMNIVGVDQKGEIIFDLNSGNTFCAVLLMGFSLFFTLLLSLYKGSPSSQMEVKTYFMVNTAGISIFLIGFTSLACYLTLPAQFQIVQFIDNSDKTVKSPLFAYLCLLIGIFVSLLITFSSQIVSSNLYFIYSLLKSCKTGAATCIISGLSMGYFYNFIPVVFIAPFAFLCYFWLGAFGVGMGLFGFSIFIPYYMNLNVCQSVMNTAAMLGYIAQGNQQSSSSLISINKSKKYFQQKIFVYSNQMLSLLGYVIIAVYAQNTKQTFATSSPYLFSGLLVGAMTSFVFSSLVIKSSYNVAPIICYDIQEQGEQNPGISKGNVEIDFGRSNHLFTMNTVLQIIKFLPFLIVPNIVTGVALGNQCLIGYMAGLLVSSMQMSVSGSMSGSLWSNTKDQISYGQAKDEKNEEISMQSQWGRSAEVGSRVGSNLRDSVGQSVDILVYWMLVMGLVFQSWIRRIHEEEN